MRTDTSQQRGDRADTRADLALRDAADVTDPHALAESHVYLIDHVVHQVSARFPRHVDRDELRGAAAAGLVDAAHRYDAATGVPFARYAAIRMRGAVLDASRTRDWATRRLRRDLREIDAATARLEEQLQRTPTDDEIAAESGMPPEQVRERRAGQLTSTLLTLDRPATLDDAVGESLGDRISEEDPAWLPDAAFERNELVSTLHDAVRHLPEELRHVLVAHHFEGRLLRDIADELGVTEARASQLRYEALRALQAYFASLYDEVDAVDDAAPGKRRRAAYVAELHAKNDYARRVDADTIRRAYSAAATRVG